MSVEEAGINHVIESLPEEYRNELRNGLRSLQPGQKTAAFSMKLVREVFNDTIGVRTEQTPTPMKGTLSLQAQTAGGKAPHVETLITNPPPQGGRGPSYNRGSSYNRDSGFDRDMSYGRGAAYGGYTNYNRGACHEGAYSTHNRGASNTGYQAYNGHAQQNRPLLETWCSLCPGQGYHDHDTVRCPYYPTPEDKKRKLYQLGLCTRCCRYPHQGECSQTIKECTVHPGQRHYTWLCELHYQNQQRQRQPQNGSVPA